MNSSLQSKIDTSIATIHRAAKLAQNYTGKPLVVAFSGGKDSQTVFHLTEAAGVDFEAAYSATTIGPPEVVRFIRQRYPMVHFHVPKMSFWQLVEKTRMLPNRHMRYCCSVLKEATHQGRVTLTGVRREESVKRAKRQILDINKKPHQFERLKKTVAKIAETSKIFPNDPKAFLEWWLSDRSVEEFKAARLPFPEVSPIVDMSFG